MDRSWIFDQRRLDDHVNAANRDVSEWEGYVPPRDYEGPAMITLAALGPATLIYWAALSYFGN
tara:strand:- start:7399 stop:7587 length:189 start_codon:yes stop_codon:yes gene_type:complete